MELTLDSGNARYRIEAYREGCIVVSGQTYTSSLVVMPNQLISPWEPKTIADLQAIHFQDLLAFKPEVVILGTGQILKFPALHILAPLYDHQIGVEVMDNAAACRTYTVLMSDNRSVMACFLME